MSQFSAMVKLNRRSNAFEAVIVLIYGPTNTTRNDSFCVCVCVLFFCWGGGG